jgi:hypothetical protein
MMGHTFEERMAGADHVHAQEKTPMRPNQLESLDGTAGQAYRVLATNADTTNVARVNVFSFKPHPPIPVFLSSLILPGTVQDVIFRMPDTGAVIVKNTSQGDFVPGPEIVVEFVAVDI